MNRQYYKRVLFAFPLGIVLGLYFSRSFGTSPEFLLALYGGWFSEDVNPLMIALYALPFMANMYLFMDIMSSDCSSASIYIFTRNGSKSRWFWWKVLTILGCSMAFLLLLIVASLIPAFLSGMQLGTIELFMQILIALMLTYIMGHIMLLLLANILCLKFKSILIYVFLLVVFLMGQLIPSIIPEAVDSIFTELYPATQAILALHDVPHLYNYQPDFFINSAKGFSIWFSAGYSIAISFFMCLLAIWWIKKTDLTLK